MDDLRERFHALDDVAVPERIASLPPLPDRGPRPPSAARRGVTALVAVVLAVASVAILVRAFRSAPPREPVDVGATRFAVHPGDPIPVGDSPNAVAVGAGAVWVSAHPADGPPYELVRLDPVTGEVVARIEVPALPTWEVGGGGLVALPDGVWVIGTVDRPEGAGCCGDAFVFRVDPTTNEVADGVDLGPGGGNDVWIDDTGVWALISDEADGADEVGISVVRLDRVSLDEVARIPLPTDWAKQVFAFDGSIWVHGNRAAASEGEGVVPDVLFRIDPTIDRYVGTVDLPSQEFSLAVDGSSIWQRSADGVIRVDPTGLLVRVPMDGMEEFCCSHIASDGAGGLWVIARDDEPGRALVVHVSAGAAVDGRAEAVVRDAVLGSVAVAFDLQRRTLWLAQYEGTVTPLRLVPD